MSSPLPSLFAGLCDDAAVFPPGNMPLTRAVPAHRIHRAAPYAGVVGLFVLGAKDLGQLADLTIDLAPNSIALSLTVPGPAAAEEALERAEAIPAVRVAALEVPVPEDVDPAPLVSTLHSVHQSIGRVLPTYVELPRDSRRTAVLAELSGSPFRAKMRTGGVRADLYPDEHELAGTILAAVEAGTPFKATAGLHHALRNTDPETGFEQHGFLNVLLATAAATDTAEHGDLVELLATRDPDTVAGRARDLDAGVRETFHSFGTCSITDPVTELVHLGLLPTDHLTPTLRSYPTEPPS